MTTEASLEEVQNPDLDAASKIRGRCHETLKKRKDAKPGIVLFPARTPPKEYLN